MFCLEAERVVSNESFRIGARVTLAGAVLLAAAFAQTGWNPRNPRTRSPVILTRFGPDDANYRMLFQSFRIGARVTLAGAVLLAAAFAQTEPSEPKNPLTRNPDAVRAGRGLYLKRCAVCQDAKGSMAANLVSSRTVRGSDAALFEVISEGFPGTEMPPQADLVPQRIWQLVTYLHSLARPGLQPPLPGDAEAGRKIFERAGCAGCHQVDGAGGFLGPPLDSIAARKTSDQIRNDVLNPDAVLPAGYEAVVAVTRGGDRVEGILKNEDTFSVQILMRDGRFRLLDRRDIAELRKPLQSAMPRDYRSKLSGGQLRNLLAYLDRQRDRYIPIQRNFSNY